MKTKITNKISTLILTILALILFGAVITFAQTPLRANGKIAFTSDRDGNKEIYLMNGNGTNQVRITNNNIIDDHPKWSPDGKNIAFRSQNASGASAIFVMNADGSGRTEITPALFFQGCCAGEFHGWNMSWSPDGQQIVFTDVVSFEVGTIVIINKDGSNRRTLTSGFDPTWSPDGTKILFIRRVSNSFPYWGLSTIHPDGTDMQDIPLSHPNYYLFRLPLTWSPDGRKIAFEAGNSANSRIDIINADGSDRQIFIGECGGFAPEGCGLVTSLPAWSPNGGKITFAFDNQLAIKNIGEEAITFLTNSGINTNPNWQPVSKAVSDFDGDGRSDISVFRPSDRTWYLNRSTAGFAATQWGFSTDKITPADYDGDGKIDISVYRDGTWYWLNSSNNQFNSIQFGLANDIPVPTDFDGDGRAELAVYRGGIWWTLNLANNQVNVIQFGLSSDKPVIADYDGDGRADPALYRNGEWHLNQSSQGYAVIKFGLASDKPVVGDYDGDGKTDEAVYRNGTWYVLQSTNGFTTFPWGFSTDTPAPADYDGDGKTDAAVYRDGVWYLRQSTNAISIQSFGLADDKPVPSAFLP
jgi:Tol biopolymer transport system component